MKEQQRQLHIRLPEQLHRALRVRAAADDKTIQELVIEILTTHLAPDSLVDEDHPVGGTSNDE